MNKIGYIYKVKNNITNEFYIGKRLYKNDKHISDDVYMGSSIEIKKAVKDFGINNFSKEILCECDSLEELNETERTLISIWADNELCMNKVNGIGYGGVYNYGICNKCKKEKVLWKNGICMSCLMGESDRIYCDKCKKETYRYPNGKCRSCVSKETHRQKFCEFCQRPTSFQGKACKNHRIILRKQPDGVISMLKVKTFGKKNKVLIKDINIFNKIQWFYIENSTEIILPKDGYMIKSDNAFVPLKSVIINKNVSNWVKVYYRMKNGRIGDILATTDHPLPINNGEIVEVKDLKVGDKLISVNGNNNACVVKLEKVPVTKNSYDVSTETEYFNINKKILSHNCRSFLSTYVDGNNKPKYWGRANLGVCTLNLAHIALSAKGNIEDFWRILDERAKLVLKAHLSRVKHLEKATSDVAPILWQHGAIARLKKGEPISNLFYNGYTTISMGYAGLYETVYALIGKSHTTEEGQELAIQIMKKLNKYCDEWKEQTGLGFSLYGTPLESTTGKLANALRRDFGEIEGITNHEYVTNSYHISVREDIDAFSKLDKESVFQALSPGGAISYVEVPDMTKNIPAVLEVIKHIYNTIMYAELNTRSDLCMECGYDGEITQKRTAFGEFVWECPNCGNRDMDKMSIVRRTCGYLSNVKNGVSSGRQGDYADRVFHL